MRSLKVLYLFASLGVLVSIFFSGCSREESFATAPSDKLSFSMDTLSFDTVFSTIGTTTAWLKIYNTGNQKIRISGIKLQSGGTSGFQINVDGESKWTYSNVDIPAKDSLFLFVKLVSSKKNANDPILVRDAILFETNGNKQQIVLQAYSRDAVIWHGKTITSDTTLTADKPFLIYDSLVVAENVTLTISEGVNLHFHDGARMMVYGNIKASGTSSNPITFRGDRLDDVLTDFPYDNYPGQWHFIRLAKSSFNNSWNHVAIRGAYYGVIADSSSMDQSKLILTNSVIHNMVYGCILSYHSKIVVENSQLTNSGSYTVCLVGGQSDFTHCTIANYQRLISRDGPALVVTNYLLDTKKKEISYPLKALFTNTIVSGSQSTEIGVALSENIQIPGDVFFKNCLLRAVPELTSERTSDCYYEPNPNFLKLGSEAEKYQYDFRIDSISPARNRACITTLTYDRNGIPRNDKPDIGAYEWIAKH